MTSISLQLAFETQQRLEDAKILSFVSGAWALNYHGVDIAIHDIELCVPSELMHQAARTLQRDASSYRRLSDCHNPDLYHCYRQGAKRFQLLRAQAPVVLFLISDDMIEARIPASKIERGLTAAKAHPELLDYCEGVNEDALSRVSWPSLASFLAVWLNLSVNATGSEAEIIYLMYAERIVDANDIDEVWCKKNFGHDSVAKVAERLLAGKENRIMQGAWT